jgi:hypothetical protein
LIAEQVARYAHSFDAQHVDTWVRLFTDDGVFEVRLAASEEPWHERSERLERREGVHAPRQSARAVGRTRISLSAT